MNVNQTRSERPPGAGDVAQRARSPSPARSASRDAPPRRWLSVAGMGLLCAAVAATAGCGGQGPKSAAPEAPKSAAGEEPKPPPSAVRKYTASSSLHVAAYQPDLALQTTAGESRRAFEILKRTQQQLLKSHLVLVAALRKPEIAKLPVLKRQDDPAAWLARELRVDFPGDAEVMEVSLTGDDPQQAAALVNAVVEAYLNEVVEREGNRRRQHLSDLERVSKQQKREVREKRTVVRALAKQFGILEGEALRLKQQAAQEQFLETLKELSQLRSDLRRAQAELEVRQTMLADPEGLKVAQFELDAFAESDPVTAQLLTPLLTELKKQIGAGLPEENLQRSLKVVQEQLDARREGLRPQLRQRKRAAIEAEIARLKDQITVLSELMQQVQKDVAEHRKEAERFVKSSLEIEMMRAEIDQLEQVLSSVAGERERLKVELDLGPRITLLQRAEVPSTED